MNGVRCGLGKYSVTSPCESVSDVWRESWLLWLECHTTHGEKTTGLSCISVLQLRTDFRSIVAYKMYFTALFHMSTTAGRVPKKQNRKRTHPHSDQDPPPEATECSDRAQARIVTAVSDHYFSSFIILFLFFYYSYPNNSVTYGRLG